MKIFLDDIRYPRASSPGWTICRNANDFNYTWVMNHKDITEISFDHDLGGELSGYDCLKFVEEYYISGTVTHLIKMNVHSMNPVGVEKMVKIIKKLEEFMMRNIDSHSEMNDVQSPQIVVK